MLIQVRQRTAPWRSSALLLGLAAGAFALGVLLAPQLSGRAEPAPAAPAPSVLPPAPRPAPAEGSLPTLQVAIAPEHWARLAAQRATAMQKGLMFEDSKAVVPAAVRIGSESATGTARLKGDWLDHIDTDQWSLRFELETPVLGMRRFSVQHPKTRGYVTEWLVMQTGKRVGVMAPRAMFTWVAINDQQPGLYYFEEHPGKELLEHQGRRDGPIVKFDETSLWATHAQLGFLQVGVLPSDFERLWTVFDAETTAFEDQRLRKLPDLEQRLRRALQQARDLQRLVVQSDLTGNALRALQNLRDLEGRTIDDLFVPEQVGKWLAVATLFQGFHGLLWNQLRLYYDPLQDRLEPILFDTGANLLLRPGEMVVTSPDARWFTASARVRVAAYEQLGRMTAPGWIEGLIADLRPELARAGAAIKQAGMEVPGFDVQDALDTLLRQQVERLRAFVRPAAAATFGATLVGLRLPTGEDTRAIEIDARATTRVPTRVSSFVFGNGRAVAAAPTLLGIVGLPDAAASVTTFADGGVLLPQEGRALRFRVPIDQRLAGLSEVQAIKQLIRQQVEGGRADARVDLAVAFRPVAEAADRSTALVLQTGPPTEAAATGRPRAPDLWTALDRHACLTYDLDTRQLRVRPGRHELTGDLLLPDDHALHLPAGTELRLDPAAVLVCGAMVAEGTAAKPVRIVAKDPAAGFGALLVLGSGGESRCRFLQVENATAIQRGPWQATGGVTFLHAPAEFSDCTVRGARGEDAINLVGTRFSFTRCEFHGGPHDLFDGDFVTGEVVDCVFADSGEDAIDVSGSLVTVRNCTFQRIGDKALSIGEGSQVTATDCRVHAAAIAVAAKDRAAATIERMVVDAVEHYVFAGYVKKPEFGPATLAATGLQWHGQVAPRHLCQTGCKVVVDGATVPPEDIDVEELYRQKVLGK